MDREGGGREGRNKCMWKNCMSGKWERKREGRKRDEEDTNKKCM